MTQRGGSEGTVLSKETAIKLSLGTAVLVVLSVGSGVYWMSGKLNDLNAASSSIEDLKADVSSQKCRNDALQSALAMALVAVEQTGILIESNATGAPGKLKVSVDEARSRLTQEC